MEEERENRRPPLAWFGAFLLVALIAGAISGAAVGLVVDHGNGSSSNSTPASSSSESRVMVQEKSAVSDAVAQVMSSVVTVVNEQPSRRDAAGNIIESVSTGSGFVVDERGLIVTNEHVVHDVGNLKVEFEDGSERPAHIVSTDAPFTDLAVLSVPPGGLKALKFGDSDALLPGQQVVAIGSALFEYKNSVTTGVVSGLHRRWLRDGVYMEDLVQTDAAINNGNSGGPLITTSGEVIGITTNVVRRLGSVDTVYGISFAISSKTMAPIVQSIRDRGVYPRPYLGIDHVNVDADLAQKNNLPVDHGALVQRVFDGSPAQKGGIRPGDVILKIGKNDVNDDMPFINALSRVGPTDKVTIEYMRDGKTQDVDVVLTPRS